MPTQEQPAATARTNDLAAQVAFFQANSYVMLPDLLPPALVAEMNAAIDRDHAQCAYFWDSEVSRNGT